MQTKKRLTSVLYLSALVFFGYFLLVNMYTINESVNSLETYGEAKLATREVNSLKTEYDQDIPFRPQMVVFFFTWVILVYLPLFFISKEDEFNHTVYAYFFIIAISILASLVYPVEPPREEVKTIDDTTPLIFWLHENKPPISVLPSFAVSLSVISGLVVNHLNKRWGWIALAYSLLVASSVVFIKEATILNAGIGFILAVFSYYLFIVKKGLE